MCRATKNMQYWPNYRFISNRWKNVKAVVKKWYSNLSLTDTSVADVLALGFPYSVHPCQRLFHETSTMQAKHPHCTIMQVAAPTMQHASCCRLGRESSVVAYLERQRNMVAFLFVTFNSCGTTTLVLPSWRIVWKLFESTKNACGVWRKCPGFLILYCDHL